MRMGISGGFGRTRESMRPVTSIGVSASSLERETLKRGQPGRRPRGRRPGGSLEGEVCRENIMSIPEQIMSCFASGLGFVLVVYLPFYFGAAMRRGLREVVRE